MFFPWSSLSKYSEIVYLDNQQVQESYSKHPELLPKGTGNNIQNIGKEFQMGSTDEQAHR